MVLRTLQERMGLKPSEGKSTEEVYKEQLEENIDEIKGLTSETLGRARDRTTSAFGVLVPRETTIRKDSPEPFEEVYAGCSNDHGWDLPSGVEIKVGYLLPRQDLDDSTVENLRECWSEGSEMRGSYLRDNFLNFQVERTYTKKKVGMGDVTKKDLKVLDAAYHGLDIMEKYL